MCTNEHDIKHITAKQHQQQQQHKIYVHIALDGIQFIHTRFDSIKQQICKLYKLNSMERCGNNGNWSNLCLSLMILI